MTTEVTKLTAYGVIGPKPGVSASKVVAYVIMQPGSSGGGSPTPSHAHSYAQILSKPNPRGAV